MQMRHCTRCRADAVGLLNESMTEQQVQTLRRSASGPLNPAESRPYVAVATREGALVNQHLGEALTLQVYTCRQGTVECIEHRDTPPPGGGAQRWQAMARLLSDCQAVLTSGAGPTPQRVLKDHGIKTLVADGLIEDNLLAYSEGRPLATPVGEFKCGTACRGDGLGCG
jgi:nitrogen fixation protein NifB